MKLQRATDYDKFQRLHSAYASEWPHRRRLKIFALDPLTRTARNQSTIRVTIDIPNETLQPGPAGERIRVKDYDGSLDVYYAPVNLDEPPILMQDGIEPTESDPRFHQQMVYAVAMRVLENFERALGRSLAFYKRQPLELFPHAFQGANAFFEPSTNAVLFGYFAADAESPGENLPGQTVFSCLSHDIIAHEVTHAIVHRLRPHFNEPTNRDVLAFHEAVADIVAIFQHFTVPDVLRDEIQNHHGELRSHGVLLGLAKQFGQGTGQADALRSAFDEDGPQPTDYLTITEPHERGSLLVSAVFDAFFVGYQRRIHDVVRLATNGTGELPTGDIQSDLVTILAGEAAASAQSVLSMCIRAFEYLPPVDVTFGDYLRALVTSDRDLYTEDKYGMRAAMIEAFRVRGIFPSDVNSLAEDSLLWPDRDCPKLDDPSIIGALMAAVVLGDDPDSSVGSPDTGEITDSTNPMPAAAAGLHAYAVANAQQLRLDPARPIRVVGFHPTFRIGSNGRVRVDVVAQFIQERQTTAEEAARLGGLPLMSGTTVIFGQHGEVRYVIDKPLHEEATFEAGRELRSLAMIERHVAALDVADEDSVWRDPAYFERRMVERANFAMLDRGRGRVR
jgi:hypothetical protein